MKNWLADPTIADLLQQSRQHAMNRKRHTGRATRDGVLSTPPDYPTAELHAAHALECRLQAHRLDPGHTDHAWITDELANKGVSHDAIVAFLTQYKDIP